jgi:enoyl-CoA hydratase/carnithine racemase
MSIHSEINDSVGHIVLDRPEKANAYDRAHLQSLATALDEIEAHCDVLIIRSTHPSVFCAGADLNEMKSATPEDAKRLYSQTLFTRISRSPLVSIAVVDGLAVGGGCELALCADIRVVSKRGVFRLPETQLGILPAAGGSTRLTGLLGSSIAKQVILAGRDISAQEAIRWGLAMDGGEDPQTIATTLAENLLTRDSDALAHAKQIIDARAEDVSLTAEREAQALLYAKRAQKK